MSLVELYKSEFDYCTQSVKKIQSEKREYISTKPAKKRWSAVQCINHLNNTAEVYIGQITKAIKEAKPDNSDNSNFKVRLITKYMVSSLEPPYKFKMKTFPVFEPVEISPEKTDFVFDKFYDIQNDFKNLIEKSFHYNLKKVIVKSPISSLVRFRLGEVFPFLAAHQRRHIWQAEKTVEILKGKQK